jgi:hypothetical protein
MQSLPVINSIMVACFYSWSGTDAHSLWLVSSVKTLGGNTVMVAGAADTRMNRHLRLIPLEPLTRLLVEDSAAWTLSSNVERLASLEERGTKRTER